MKLVDSLRTIGPVAVALLLQVVVVSSARAEDVTLIPPESRYRYHLGNTEASEPDTTAWLAPDFDDSGWTEGQAPFGYGDPPFFTDLSTVEPPMRNNYTGIFLRRTFTVDPEHDNSELRLEADYDDGFIAWINGVEVVRENMRSEPGDPVTLTDRAERGREAGEFVVFELVDALDYLVPGENTIAVRPFNSSRSSNDFRFDLRLINPNGPDLTSPTASVSPAPGIVLTRFDQLKVRFDEPVTGLGATDLLAGGQPATGIEDLGDSVYRFTFEAASAGELVIEWAADHGITDVSPARNPFVGESYTYTIDPDAPLPAVRIAEFLASNRSGILDSDGETSDWIELENLEDHPVELSGWSLSDDPAEPDRWVFPEITLAAGERLLVFASGQNRRDPDEELHANFQLSSEGEFLALYNSELPPQVVSSFRSVPPQYPDHSYGRGESDAVGYFETPGPGEPNDPTALLGGRVGNPRFSHEPGLYEEAFSLELTTGTPGAEIRYTLDGSAPTADSGLLYEGPVQVEGGSHRPGVVVRARAFGEGLLSSDTLTRTFVFPEAVLDQEARPTGFPLRWGAAPGVDYEMDPQMLANGTTAERVREGLRSIPTVSVVTDVQDMFGPRGIYSNTTSSGFAWERACSAELIYPDGRPGFQIDCGIRILGGASRQPAKSPKHSFRLLFKGLYGPTRLRFPLYEDSDVESFDNLVLRANYNNSWIHWDSGQRRRGMLIRDQWAKDTQLAMGQASGHAVYTHLYLNGLYWGVYILVERPNAAFAASYHGGDREDYDALNSAQAVDGNLARWTQLLQTVRGPLGDAAAFQNLRKHLDVENFIDYMLINFYGSNADWPHHNWYAAVRRDREEGYRFYCWDTERILENTGSSRLGVNDGNSPGEIHARLRAHPEYQVAFADRVQKHFFDEGALTPQKAWERFDARATEIETAIYCESARWGDYRRDVHSSSNGPYELYQVVSHWLPQLSRLETLIFPAQTNALLGLFRGSRLYPRIDAPRLAPLPGVVEAGSTVELVRSEGQDGDLYYTLDGADPRVAFSGDVAETARLHAGELIDIPFRTQIRARLLTESGWSALVEGTYRTPVDLTKLRISEIHYRPVDGSRFEFLELHNSGTDYLDLEGVSFDDGIEFSFRPGDLLAPGEYAVLVSDELSFRAFHPDARILGEYEGQLDNGGERLTIENGAGEVLISLRYDDEGFWPLAADGLGFSIVPLDGAERLDSPHAWRPSTSMGGSPGEADAADLPDLVLVERVMPRPASPGEEAWIDLHNAGNRRVDLGGWFLGDRRGDLDGLRQLRLPQGLTLEPGEVRRFHESDLEGWAGDLEIPAGPGGLFLSAASSEGILTGPVTGLEYDLVSPGAVIGVIDTSLDLDVGRVEVIDGQSVPWLPEVVIHEIHYHPAPDGGPEFIELHNRTDREISLHEADLGVGWRLRGLSSADGPGSFTFPRGTRIPPRGYLLVVEGDAQAFREARGLPRALRIVGTEVGSLDNGGEELRLERPGRAADGSLAHERIDRVLFDDRDPWDVSPDGTGPSLERRSSELHGNDALHWGASLVEGGTPGRLNSIEESRPTGGHRVPGDISVDGRTNLSDVIQLLRHLYQGTPATLPCEAEGGTSEGDLALLDANGDRSFDQADAVHQLLYLFGQGPEHVLGVVCLPIQGCPEMCFE